MNSKLTLNLGVRWEVQTPPTDPQNRFTNYVPGQRSTVNPLAPVGALFFGDPGVERAAIPVSYNHFSPRFGFAYDPFADGKTSIRGAIGLFYGSISGNEWGNMTNFQPWSTRLSFTNLNRRGIGATLSNPYNAYVGGNPFPYNGAFTSGGGFFAVAPDFDFPRTLQIRWFNTAAFAQNTLVTGVATDGNSPRNFLYGPGFRVVDLALSRDFKIGERFKLRLRGEGTNVFNLVNLGQPNSTFSTGTSFGTITDGGAMRILQFGVRFTF